MGIKFRTPPAHNERFKGKLSLRPVKCTLTDFKPPNKLENQGIRQEGKKSGDGKDKDPHHRRGFGGSDYYHEQMLCAPATVGLVLTSTPSSPQIQRQKIGFSSSGKSKHFGGGIVSHSCDPVDCSPPGSSVPGILQARILQWVAISFSGEK